MSAKAVHDATGTKAYCHTNIAAELSLSLSEGSSLQGTSSLWQGKYFAPIKCVYWSEESEIPKESLNYS
jgi:hypothetical protein